MINSITSNQPLTPAINTAAPKAKTEPETSNVAETSNLQISEVAYSMSVTTYSLAEANDVIALTETIENALSYMEQNLQRMYDLAINTQNDSYSDMERMYMQMEYSFMQQEQQYGLSGTTFDGAMVFTDSFEQVFTLANEDGSETVLTVSLTNSMTILSGVNSTNVSSLTAGAEAVTEINKALAFIASTKESLNEVKSQALAYINNAPTVDDETRAGSDVLQATGAASDIYTEIEALVTNMLDLTYRSFDQSLSDTERGYLNIEYTQLQVELNRVSNKPIADTSIAEGSYSGQVNIGEASFDVTIGEDSQAVLAALDTSLDSWWDRYDAIGILQNTLSAIENELENIAEFEVEVASYISATVTTSASLQTVNRLLGEVNGQFASEEEVLFAAQGNISKEQVLTLLR